MAERRSFQQILLGQLNIHAPTLISCAKLTRLGNSFLDVTPEVHATKEEVN